MSLDDTLVATERRCYFLSCRMPNVQLSEEWQLSCLKAEIKLPRLNFVMPRLCLTSTHAGKVNFEEFIFEVIHFYFLTVE